MISGSGMIEAAKKGDVSAVRRLASEDPALCGFRAASGETPLMAALYRGHRGVVDALVDLGAPLDVFAAAALGRVDILRSRIAERAEAVNEYAYDGWTPLHLAAFFGHAAAISHLLDSGSAIDAISRNSLRNTPLHAAIAGGHVDGARLLMERGADVHPADAGGHTPLHIAAEAGYADLVKALLARGADPHAVDAEDQTPLSRAAARNHHTIVDLINVDR
jgi:ankyrin repeat protein